MECLDVDDLLEAKERFPMPDVLGLKRISRAVSPSDLRVLTFRGLEKGSSGWPPGSKAQPGETATPLGLYPAHGTGYFLDPPLGCGLLPLAVFCFSAGPRQGSPGNLLIRTSWMSAIAASAS